MTRYDELMAGLRKGKVLPVYLFFGEEGFLIQEAADLIVRTVVDPAGQDFNFTTVYCRSATGAEIVNLCQTLPFMAERRLVIAKEVEALKAAETEALIGYLRDPSPSTCLVLIANQPKYDRKPVISAVEEQGAVVRVFAPLDREMLPWIESWARSRGLSIERDAAQYVWQSLGSDLQTISNELQKAVIGLQAGKTITLEDVRAVVGDFREYTSFDLAEAIGRKDVERALQALHRLIQEGEQPVGLLAMVHWNFRRLLRAKAMEEAGAGFEEIKRKLSVIFHQARSFQEQMQRYRMPELTRAFEAMLQADRALKSGRMTGRLALERMILRLCGA